LGAVLKQIIVIIVVKRRMCRAGPAVWYACPASGGIKYGSAAAAASGDDRRLSGFSR